MEQTVIKFCNVMYGALRPAFSTASKFAKENKTPYSVLITTTPSDLDSDNGVFTYNLIQSACRWDEHMYDWYWDRDGGEEGEAYVRNHIEENSQNNFVYIEYSYKELGKDDAWFRKQIKELNNNMSLVKRELLLEWTHASVDSVFSEETLDRVSKFAERKSINDFKKIYLLNNKYPLYIIEEMDDMPFVPWLVSADIGGGLSQDRTVLTVIDPYTSRVKALLISNTMPVDELEAVVVELKKNYLFNMVFAPERNYSGDYLIKNLFKNKEVDFTDSITYYKLSDNLLKKRMGGARSGLFNTVNGPLSTARRSKDTSRYEYGVITNTKTRRIMVENILFNLVEETPELINNPFIFSELKTLVKTKTGKIEHQAGGHDDIIMSYLIGLYVLQNHTEACKKQFRRKNPNRTSTFRNSIRSATGEDEKEKQTSQSTKTILKMQHFSDLISSNGASNPIYERDRLLKKFNNEDH